MAYKSPIGLFDFQAEGVALCYERPNNLVVWDQGLGKTHLALATSSLLFEDDKIDRVLVVVKKNKIEEWLGDFAEFTDLQVELYHGPKRAKLLESLPQVLITTYETARNDSVSKERVDGRKSPKLVAGRLLAALEGQRVLIVYDEFVRLANRTSALFKSQEFLIKTLRPDCRVMALTGTPLTRSPENFYNLGRLLVPGGVGTVKEFEQNYIRTYDFFGNPQHFKNLEPGDDLAPGITPLSEKLGSIIIRKRKSDADVVAQFPKEVEEFSFIDLLPKQRDFYDAVEDLFADEPGIDIVRRQIAAHPASLLRSESELAKAIVSHVGPEGIKAIPSAKTEYLLDYLTPLTLGQGDQVVVFTFFGPSVIPHLQETLEGAGISCALYYGGVQDREAQKEEFKKGEKMVFLASDAGSDGINLPEASYVVEYEISTTYATRSQRLARISRITSDKSIVHYQTFIARDTVEERMVDKVLLRNEWAESLYEIGDRSDAFVTAEKRRELIEKSR